MRESEKSATLKFVFRFERRCSRASEDLKCHFANLQSLSEFSHSDGLNVLDSARCATGVFVPVAGPRGGPKQTEKAAPGRRRFCTSLDEPLMVNPMSSFSSTSTAVTNVPVRGVEESSLSSHARHLRLSCADKFVCPISAITHDDVRELV